MEDLKRAQYKIGRDIETCLNYVMTLDNKEILAKPKTCGEILLCPHYCRIRKLPDYVFKELVFEKGLYKYTQISLDIHRLRGDMTYHVNTTWFMSSLTEFGKLGVDYSVFQTLYKLLFKLNPMYVKHLPILFTPDEVRKYVLQHPMFYRHMPSKYHTKEFAMSLIRENLKVFKGVPNRLKTPDMCKYVLEQNRGYIQYVPLRLRTPEIIAMGYPIPLKEKKEKKENIDEYLRILNPRSICNMLNIPQSVQDRLYIEMKVTVKN